MTEPDFDAYLHLLSRLLRLTRGQQAEITSELRDHLEERYADLLSQGHPREAAIRLALDELGDAAVLAGEFAPSLQVRHRRNIMRYSILSASAVAVTFVVASLFGPAGPEQGGNSTFVQAQDQPAEPKPKADLKPPTEEELRRQIEEKLARRDVPLDFHEMPLEEALMFFGDALELDFLMDRKYLEDLGISGDQPVTLKTRPGALSVRTAIELILHQVGDNELTFAIRDGVVMITGPEADYENEVYDCRDLIEGVHVNFAGGLAGQPGAMGGGGGFFQVGPTLDASLSQFGGGTGMGGMGGGQGAGGSSGGPPQPTATSASGRALIGVIQAATAPEHWFNVDGEGGTISEYDGLMIIHHSQRVHRKVEELLMKLRTAQKDPHRPQPGRAGGGMPGALPGGGASSSGAPGAGSGLPPGSGAGSPAPGGRPDIREESPPNKPGRPKF